MHAIELIKQDHRTVEALFTRYEQETSPEQKREILNEIVRELSVHAAAEEMVLYPVVKEVLRDGEDMIEDALTEHKEVKLVLADLDGMDAGDPEMDQKVMTLREDVLMHVQEEESDLLPRLERELGDEILMDMGEELQKQKQHAPTRPHPHAPDEPPGITLAAPMAALVDRVRDRMQGRRAG